MKLQSDPVRVLVTLEKGLLSDPTQLDVVCQQVEGNLWSSNRELLRFGILSGQTSRSQLHAIEDLPGVQSVELDAPKFALGG